MLPSTRRYRGCGTRYFARRSLSRVLATYALATAIPVVLLGIALGVSYSSEAKDRGVAEGRSEALLVAQTAVEPLAR